MTVDSHSDDDLSPSEQLQEFLEEIVQSLRLEADVEVSESGGELRGNVAGEGVGLLIGRRGQTIDAVQHLAQRIVFQGGPRETRITIDADGYRARRKEMLEEEADAAAEQALGTGAPAPLQAMPASERRIVHEYLRDRADIETYSEGEEPDRHLVVAPLAK